MIINGIDKLCRKCETFAQRCCRILRFANTTTTANWGGGRYEFITKHHHNDDLFTFVHERSKHCHACHCRAVHAIRIRNSHRMHRSSSSHLCTRSMYPNLVERCRVKKHYEICEIDFEHFVKTRRADDAGVADFDALHRRIA